MTRTTVPLDPDAPEARDWILEELARPVYQAAKPTWFDLASQAVWDWLRSLSFEGADAPPYLGMLLLGVITAAALLVAFLVFGVPRLNRRSRGTAVLFGEQDSRDSAAMAAAARAAAATGDFTLATAEMYRAIARRLDERGIVTMSPGSTARGFAERAGARLPEHGEALHRAADDFDTVRYLGRPGSADAWQRVAALDEATRHAVRPPTEARG